MGHKPGKTAIPNRLLVSLGMWGLILSSIKASPMQAEEGSHFTKEVVVVALGLEEAVSSPNEFCICDVVLFVHLGVIYKNFTLYCVPF